MASDAAATAAQQREVLSLIRGFATERSQGELRVSDLRRRFVQLQEQSDAESDGLQLAKRAREAAERELRASELQLSLADASTLALQSRIHLLQEEISKLRDDLTAIKEIEGSDRDGFLAAMCELNSKIREFQKMTASALQRQCPSLLLDGGSKQAVLTAKHTLQDVKDDVERVDLQLHSLESDYHDEMKRQDKILQEIAYNERRLFLIDAITDETRQVQDLGWQTMELEKTYASVGFELQNKCICPRCHLNNMGALKERYEPVQDN